MNFRYNFLFHDSWIPSSVGFRVSILYPNFDSHAPLPIVHGISGCSWSELDPSPNLRLRNDGLAHSFIIFRLQPTQFDGVQRNMSMRAERYLSHAAHKRFTGFLHEEIYFATTADCLNDACHFLSSGNAKLNDLLPFIRMTPSHIQNLTESSNQCNTHLQLCRQSQDLCELKSTSATENLAMWKNMHELCTQQSHNLLHDAYMKHTEDSCGAPVDGDPTTSQFVHGMTVALAYSEIRKHPEPDFITCVLDSLASDNATNCEHCCKALVDCLSSCSFNPLQLATCGFCVVQKTLVYGPKCWSCGRVIVSFFQTCVLRSNQRRARRHLMHMYLN